MFEHKHNVKRMVSYTLKPTRSACVIIDVGGSFGLTA